MIAHECGHGVSNRLTGGPTHVACLDNAEHMGEGWSDFMALFVTAAPARHGLPRAASATTWARTDRLWHPADAVLDQPRGRPGDYATLGTGDPDRPHGIGYAWASMVWEVYWNLVDEHGFNPNSTPRWATGGNNLAMQLVIDGMKLQPCSPGFVDGRDAILADQLLTNGENQCAIGRLRQARVRHRRQPGQLQKPTTRFRATLCRPTASDLKTPVRHYGRPIGPPVAVLRPVKAP